MRAKDQTVRFTNLHPKTAWAIFQVDPVVRLRLGYEPVITSCNDGTHKRGSAHYSGRAFDLRTWTTENSGQQIGDNLRGLLAHDCAAALDDDFDVVVEADHLHIEYDPKAPT